MSQQLISGRNREKNRLGGWINLGAGGEIFQPGPRTIFLVANLLPYNQLAFVALISWIRHYLRLCLLILHTGLLISASRYYSLKGSGLSVLKIPIFGRVAVVSAALPLFLCPLCGLFLNDFLLTLLELNPKYCKAPGRTGGRLEQENLIIHTAYGNPCERNRNILL